MFSTSTLSNKCCIWTHWKYPQNNRPATLARNRLDTWSLKFLFVLYLQFWLWKNRNDSLGFSLNLLHALLQTFWVQFLPVSCPLKKRSSHVPEAHYESAVQKAQEQPTRQRICKFGVRVNRCRKSSEKEDKTDHHGGWMVIDMESVLSWMKHPLGKVAADSLIKPPVQCSLLSCLCATSELVLL